MIKFKELIQETFLVFIKPVFDTIETKTYDI